MSKIEKVCLWHWECQRAEDGHRYMYVTYLVRSAAKVSDDIVCACPGLPAIGDTYDVGLDRDSAAKAVGKPTVVLEQEDSDGALYKVVQKYSTRPGDTL